MKAVILAGGQGTRLKSVIHDIPKPMAPVHGRPFLEYLLSNLVSNGIRDIILSVGYLHEKIVDHFGNGRHFQCQISYCIEQEPLGTGGAVRKALLMADCENILVMNGDTFVDIDCKDLSAFHKTLQTVATMAVVSGEDASRYGTVKVSPDGHVTAFSEKEATTPALINAGVYVFNKEILTLIPPGTVSLESDILPVMAVAGNLGAQIQEVPFIDIGLPSAYKMFCENFTKYTNSLSPRM
jgi:D-glycero-alpha-D-manno-heptose 1-phosphate guanylyltransferase